MLGSTLTSVSLVLQTLAEGIERERGAIEARIAQGGTRFAAFMPLLRRAMRTATTPLLNIMSVAGVVTLPGMMTGQILAGADPVEAARYQIVLMFVLAGAAGLGAFAAAFGGVLLLSDTRHRLRLDRLASVQWRLSQADRATTSYRPNLAPAGRRPTGTPNPSWPFESAAKAFQ